MLFRRKREKVFGNGLCIPLDRNAKTRIMIYIKAWNARHKTGRQHRGPITRAFMGVLETLLWGFHNSRDGRCFPSYEWIAQKAGCARSTVSKALKVLELTGILTWQNRIARIKERAQDLFGRLSVRWRVIRTSNAYAFQVPQPGQGSPVFSKSENQEGTPIKEEKKKERTGVRTRPTLNSLYDPTEEDARARRSASQQLLALGFAPS